MTTAQRIAELAAKGLPQRDVALTLGVSRQYVSQTAQRHSIKFSGRAQHRQHEHVTLRIERMKAECVGMTVAQAAQHLGVSLQTVYNDRNNFAFDGLVSVSRTRSDQTKLILERAPTLAKRGYSKSEVAREIGVTLSQLTHATRRYAPDLKWRDGRKDGKGGRRVGGNPA